MAGEAPLSIANSSDRDSWDVPLDSGDIDADGHFSGASASSEKKSEDDESQCSITHTEAEVRDWQEVATEDREDQYRDAAEASPVGLRSAAEERALRVRAEASLAQCFDQRKVESQHCKQWKQLAKDGESLCREEARRREKAKASASEWKQKLEMAESRREEAMALASEYKRTAEREESRREEAMALASECKQKAEREESRREEATALASECKQKAEREESRRIKAEQAAEQLKQKITESERMRMRKETEEKADWRWAAALGALTGFGVSSVYFKVLAAQLQDKVTGPQQQAKESASKPQKLIDNGQRDQQQHQQDAFLAKHTFNGIKAARKAGRELMSPVLGSVRKSRSVTASFRLVLCPYRQGDGKAVLSFQLEMRVDSPEAHQAAARLMRRLVVWILDEQQRRVKQLQLEEDFDPTMQRVLSWSCILAPEDLRDGEDTMAVLMHQKPPQARL